MILSMNEQFFLFFASFLMGITGGFLYGLIIIFRRYIAHSIIGIYIEDILYWLIYSSCVFLTLLYLNYADIRVYMFVGIFGGLIIYRIFIHKWIEKLLSPFIFLLRLSAEIILTPFMAVLYPIKKFYEYLKKHLKKSRKYEKILLTVKHKPFKRGK